jgi:hypothetical protein
MRHVLFRCPVFHDLQVNFEYLYDLCGIRLSTDMIHAFMNQRNVIEVAKFVQQLQNRVENDVGTYK